MYVATEISAFSNLPMLCRFMNPFSILVSAQPCDGVVQRLQVCFVIRLGLDPIRVLLDQRDYEFGNTSQYFVWAIYKIQ